MKKYFTVIYLSLIFLLPMSIFASPHGRRLEIDTKGPSLEEVNQEVIRHLQYNLSEMKRWRNNSRWSAVLPRIQVSVRRDIKDVIQLNSHDNISITSGDVFVGPTENSYDQNFDQGTQVDVRALWQLNELIFSRDSLSVSSEIRDIIRDKNKVLQEVNMAFHARIRLLYELTHGSLSPDIREKKNNLLDQMNGVLDAYTEGWFSRIINEKRVQ